MLEELLDKKISQIEKKAVNEKAAATYLVNLIEDNFDEYKQAVDPDNKIIESDLPQRIYENVERVIDEISYEYTRPVGAMCHRFKKGSEPKSVGFKLGWIDLNRQNGTDEEYESGKTLTYITFPSDKGFEIINGYRKAKGLSSLDETKKEKDWVGRLTESKNNLVKTK